MTGMVGEQQEVSTSYFSSFVSHATSILSKASRYLNYRSKSRSESEHSSMLEPLAEKGDIVGYRIKGIPFYSNQIPEGCENLFRLCLFFLFQDAAMAADYVKGYFVSSNSTCDQTYLLEVLENYTVKGMSPSEIIAEAIKAGNGIVLNTVTGAFNLLIKDYTGCAGRPPAEACGVNVINFKALNSTLISDLDLQKKVISYLDELTEEVDVPANLWLYILLAAVGVGALSAAACVAYRYRNQCLNTAHKYLDIDNHGELQTARNNTL